MPQSTYLEVNPRSCVPHTGSKSTLAAEPIPVFDRTGNCVFLAPPFSYSLDRKERSHVLCWRSRFPLLLLGIWMLMRFLLITIPHVSPPPGWTWTDSGWMLRKRRRRRSASFFGRSRAIKTFGGGGTLAFLVVFAPADPPLPPGIHAQRRVLCMIVLADTYSSFFCLTA